MRWLHGWPGLVLGLALGVGCAEPERSTFDAVSAPDGEPGVSSRSDAGQGNAGEDGGASAEGPPAADVSDAGLASCRTREIRAKDGACRCPEEDVLCPTRGYAHFTISNVVGSGFPNEASYQVTDGLVEDTVTGLIWERIADPRVLSFQEAKKRCDDLVLEGRDDFRLPGRIELVTILDFTQLPVIASEFEQVVADYHWSSSPASFVEGSAYTVYFGAGETTIARASPGQAVSRCVAGDVHAISPQFEVDAERVVDRASGLVWERILTPPTNWEDAKSRCESQRMRLPSVRELQSIVDENRFDPAMDPAVFPDAVSEGFWTSTLRGSDPWYVDFTDGKTHADRPTSDVLRSRCVQ